MTLPRPLSACLLLVGCLLFSLPARADSPGSRVLLLHGDTVRQQLRLTPTQASTIDRLKSEYRREIQPFLARADERSLTMLQASTAAFNRRATAVLTPGQREQLRGIEHRILGPWMLHAPSVQEELHLSLEQRTRIDAIQDQVEAYNQRLHGDVTSGRLTPAARLHRLREYRERQHSSLLRVLTTEQRQAFAQMAGTI